MAMRGLTMMLVGSCEAYSLIGAMPHAGMRAASPQMIEAATNSWYYNSPQSKTDINWDPAFGDNTNARRETLSSASAMTGVVTPTQANNDWYHASPQAKTAINWDPAFGDNTNARKAQLSGHA